MGYPAQEEADPLHRATGRMTFDVHTHVRRERVLGIVHVGRSMSVCVVQCQTEHVLATRACSLNSGVRKAIAKQKSMKLARVRGIKGG